MTVTGRVLSCCAGMAVLLAAVSTSARADGGLATAVFDPIALAGAPALAFQRIRTAGATVVRIQVQLGDVAPGGSSMPQGFDASNPADPQYNWSEIDAEVEGAVSADLEPILCLAGAPAWAKDTTQSGEVRPSAKWYGRFAHAAAARYSGHFGVLHRVRYWQAWNEPNLEANLAPARVNGNLFSPDWYRGMVNAFAHGVKAVDPTNLVIAGGLAPYAALDGPGIPPLTFMRALLCVDRVRVRPRPRCLGTTNFDIWSMQPYTWGGPTHHATVPGDLALGDLPVMRDLLQQAWQSGRINAPSQPRFWVTEFSWNTNPPSPGGVAIDLQTRWTAQALYVMWQSGVSLVTWFMLRDQPAPSQWRSGLYFAGSTLADDVEKPTLKAYRFPQVAFPAEGGIAVWARTPTSAPGAVTFEQDTGTGWVPLGTLTADANGIVSGVLPGVALGSVRASYEGETSVPFSLADVPDQDVNPFG